MRKYLEIFQKCALFQGISSENIIGMLKCLGAKSACYNKKETVIMEGEPARYVGLVLSGTVQVEKVDYYGNRSIVAKIEPGELFGESFACAGVEKIPVNVIANEEAQVLLIDCHKIMQPCCNACEFHQQMIYNLVKIVARKNLMFHQKFEITSKRTTREKLMAYLLVQAKKAGSNRFDIPYDRQELADYLEVDRSGLSAEISKLRKEGILESKRNYFELR